MKLLLDSHVVLWMYGDPDRLSARARGLLADPANELVLSVVVGWELGIKLARGKLRLPQPLEDFLLDRIQRDRLVVLPIELAHVLDCVALPPHHADPFDRMLVAQARSEELRLLTADPQISRYDVLVVRA